MKNIIFKRYKYSVLGLDNARMKWFNFVIVINVLITVIQPIGVNFLDFIDLKKIKQIILGKTLTLPFHPMLLRTTKFPSRVIKTFFENCALHCDIK